MKKQAPATPDDPEQRRLGRVLRLVILSLRHRMVISPRLREAAASLLNSERGPVQRGNLFLVKWISLSLLVLLLLMIFMISGYYEALETRQIMMLCGEPFLIEAEKIQQPLLSPQVLFAICVALTLYLSLVLLREASWGRRTQICFLVAVTVALPGLLCVFWGGLVNPSAPMFCVAALWLVTSLIPFYCRRIP